MLSASYKQDLLKPKMDEDQKCPKALMTWGHDCHLQSTLDFAVWGRGCSQSPEEPERALHCPQTPGRVGQGSIWVCGPLSVLIV